MEKLTFDEWKKLGPEKASKYLAKRIGLNKDRREKLKLILEHEWGGSIKVEG